MVRYHPTMPGYSGTPLPKKLGIKDGFCVSFFNQPADVHKKLSTVLKTCTTARDPETPIDFAMVFTKSRAELSQQFARFTTALAPAGMLWISWPKKSSRVATEIDENVVREMGLNAGLVDVKVCAVTEIWSGLKFVRRVRDRKKNEMSRKTKAHARHPVAG